MFNRLLDVKSRAGSRVYIGLVRVHKSSQRNLLIPNSRHFSNRKLQPALAPAHLYLSDIQRSNSDRIVSRKARPISSRFFSLSVSTRDKASVMPDLYQDDTPPEVKEAQGVHLLTQSTPNGQKVQILLEELALVYGTSWTTTLIDISTNKQKEEWYLRLNPNGRIPTIVDNTQSPPFPVMETSAELLYLVQKFDKEGVFSFADDAEANSQMLQWLFFWHGSGAPYQSQLGFFGRAAEKLPMAIDRFRKETLRVFGVLEIQLSGRFSGQPREFLVGKGVGKYSVADIGTWTWISKWKMSGLKEEDMEQFPQLMLWMARIAERPAVIIATGAKYSKK